MSSTDPTAGTSQYPAERNPRLLLVAYRGDLGMDTGYAQSVYTLDQSQLDSGKLKQVAASKGLKPGEVWTLPDSSKVEFVGTRPWVTLTVRHDPGEPFVFGAAVCLLIGLLLSLSGKRRRIWFRSTGDRATDDLASGGPAVGDPPLGGQAFGDPATGDPAFGGSAVSNLPARRAPTRYRRWSTLSHRGDVDRTVSTDVYGPSSPPGGPAARDPAFGDPATGGRIEAGGLPRTDYAGFTAEFDEIVRAARNEGIFT
jgi:cytochrome c biogenesis protein ResB